MCIYYQCFNKVPDFKLKRNQEIAIESMLMNQHILVMLPHAHGKS